jgi:hypothetical protein
MGLERGPLSLVSTTEELLRRKSSGSGLEIEITAVGIRCADHATPLYPQKLALTSPTSGGRSVSIVRSRTKATELLLLLLFRKTNTDLIPLEINGILVNKLHDIAEAFSKHFQEVYSTSCRGTLPVINRSTEVLSLAPISNAAVQNAIKWLRPTKCVGLDGILIFIVKGCYEMFLSVLKITCKLTRGLSQNTFPNLWKQAAIVTVSKKGELPLLEIISYTEQ